MDFLGGALPNVMFIVGMLAIGLGLGIELKLVPLNREIDKTGRIGAIFVGAILVLGSIFIYLNPAIAKRDQGSGTTAALNAAAIAPVVAEPSVAASTPSATISAEPAVAPAQPSPIPPSPVPPSPVPQVKVPDLHGLSEKDIRRQLEGAGLAVGNKTDACTGPDQGDPRAKKGRVQCQNPPAGAMVPARTAIDYTLAGK